MARLASWAGRSCRRSSCFRSALGLRSGVGQDQRRRGPGLASSFFRLSSGPGAMSPGLAWSACGSSCPPGLRSAFRRSGLASGPPVLVPLVLGWRGAAWCDLAELAAIRGRGRSSGAGVLRDQFGPLRVLGWPGLATGRRSPGAGWIGPELPGPGQGRSVVGFSGPGLLILPR